MCDAPISGDFFFFFWLLHKFVVIKKSLSRQNTSIVLAPLSYVPPSRTRMPVVSTRLYRGRQSSYVMRGKAPLSQAHLALSCQLCRDQATSCRDMTSTSRPKLGHDLEYQVVTWEPQAISKSVATKNSLSRQNSLAMPAQGLSCAPGLGLSLTHGLLCYNTTQRHTFVRASLRKPSPVMCDRAFYRGQLGRNIELLYRNTKPLHLATICHDTKYFVTTENS